MTLPLEYFYNDTVAHFYICYIPFIACLTFLTAPLLISAIITQSEVTRKLKVFLLNHIFWLLIMELVILIWRPVFLLPLAGGFQLGFFKGTSYKTTIIAVMSSLMVVVFSTLALTGTFIERYVGVFHGIFKTIWDSIYCKIFYVFCYIVVFCVACFYIVVLTNVDRHDMTDIALNMSSSLIMFVNEPTFIAIGREVHKVGDILMMIACWVIVAGAVMIITIFAYYLYKHGGSKTLTTKLQRTLLANCIAQLVTAVILIGLPMIYLFTALYFESPYSGVTMMFMVCLLSSEPFLDFVFCIFLIAPYRRFVINLLCKPFRSTNDVMTIIINNVQIFNSVV